MKNIIIIRSWFSWLNMDIQSTRRDAVKDFIFLFLSIFKTKSKSTWFFLDGKKTFLLGTKIDLPQRQRKKKKSQCLHKHIMQFLLWT